MSPVLTILALSDIDGISLNVCTKEYEVHFCTSYLFLESAASTAEATGTSARTTTRSAAARTASEAEGILTASEEVQTVDDMQHAVTGDGVVFGIGAPHRRDGTAEGGLLVQDVVELQGDGEGLMSSLVFIEASL